MKLTRQFCLLALALFITVVAYSGTSDAACSTPTPGDMYITRPGADVPEEYAKFSGIWKDGKWDGILCHLLAVESIEASGRVTFVYTWGIASRWRIHEPGYVRRSGKIEDGKLKATLGNGAKVTYWHEDANTLKGTYKRRDKSYITLKKASE